MRIAELIRSGEAGEQAVREMMKSNTKDMQKLVKALYSCNNDYIIVTKNGVESGLKRFNISNRIDRLDLSIGTFFKKDIKDIRVDSELSFKVNADTYRFGGKV